MNGLPLHPAIVHLPLGLALVIPLGALVVTWLAWRRPRAPEGRLSRGPIAALVVAQALLVGGGLLAQAAGEQDEERVEALVAESVIERHEDQAGVFVLAGALVLGGFAAAWVLARRPRFARPTLTVAALGTVAVLALGLSVGHSGGELVYRHGAASAHLSTPSDGQAGARTPLPVPVHHDSDD